MISFPLPHRRRPAPTGPGQTARHLHAVVDPAPVDGPLHPDLRLEPGNLVEVSDALGAQMFSVIGDEVTFTARSAEGEQHWRGRLGACGLLHLRG